MFTEERLERLTKNIGESDMDSLLLYDEENYSEDRQENLAEISASNSPEHGEKGMLNDTVQSLQRCQLCTSDIISKNAIDDNLYPEHRNLKEENSLSEVLDNNFVVPEAEKLQADKKSLGAAHLSEACDTPIADISINNNTSQMHLPISQHQLYESLESSSR